MNPTRYILLGTSAVLILGSLRGSLPFEHYFQLNKSLKVIDHKVNQLNLEVQTLQDEIRKIKISPRYAKKVLRDKYHITEDNEIILYFPD